MSQFLTDSESGEDKSRPKVRGKKGTNYKDHVIKSLQFKGTTQRIAEIAVIDLAGMVTTFMHLKKSPTEAADGIWSEVERIYKRPDGSWHYTNNK